jgi:ATP-dependent DNA ligase
VFDAELVALSSRDAPPVQDFAAVCRATLQADAAAARKLHLVAFDLLELDGEDLRALPWVKRTSLLRETFPADHRLRLVQTLPASRAAHDQLVAIGFEGSVLKRPGSRYRPGRQTTWRKYKASHRATPRCAPSDPDATGTPTQSPISTAGVLPPSAARGSPN